MMYTVYTNSTNIKRYGRYNKVFQRYYCKDRNRTFNDKTNTIFHYKHIGLSDYFIAISSIYNIMDRFIDK